MSLSNPATRPGWLLVIPWDTSATGGVSQVVLNLARGLKEQGAYEPTIIVADWHAVRARTEIREGLRHVFIRIREPGGGGSFIKRLLLPVLAFVENFRLTRLLKSLNTRVVNFHFPDLRGEQFFRRPAVALRRRLRVIFSFHGADITAVARGNYRARFLRMISHGDAAVTVSDALARVTAQTLGSEVEGRLRTIHNGVRADLINSYEPIDVALPSHYILNVATFEDKKGQRYLLDAFAQIAPEHPTLDLVLAGRPAGAMESVVRQITELGLERRVRILRDVAHSRVGSLFASASLFCLSSLAEGLPIVLLEAGVFGLPVIASRIDGIPEIIRDGVDGILVPPADPIALAAGIRKLLAAPDRGHALATSLRNRILDIFTWQRAVSEYIALAEKEG